jgi:hypothetical protein
VNAFPAFRLSGFPAFRLSGFPAFRLSAESSQSALARQGVNLAQTAAARGGNASRLT